LRDPAADVFGWSPDCNEFFQEWTTTPLTGPRVRRSLVPLSGTRRNDFDAYRQVQSHIALSGFGREEC
jgi:hypothetical protein